MTFGSVWMQPLCPNKNRDGAIIAAKSVVTRDVAPYTIVGGNPAHKIRERFSNAIIEELLQIQWWHFHIEKSLKI